MSRRPVRLALWVSLSTLALGCQRGCGTGAGAGPASQGSSAALDAAPRELPSLVLPEHLPSRVVFSADGKLLASVGQHEVLVWDVAARRVAHGFPIDAEEVHFSPDATQLAAVTLNHVRILVPDGERVSNPVPGMGDPSGNLTDPTRVEGVGWLGPKELVAGFRNGERVSIVDGKLGPRAPLSSRPVSLVSWDTGRRRVALVPDDPAAPTELASGPNFEARVQLAWPGRDSSVLAVRFSPTGDAVAGLDNRVGNDVRIWDAASGRQRLALREPADRINDLAWSPDGKRLALSAHDTGLHVVSAETGAVLKARALPDWSAHGVAWSPDGRSLAFVGSGVSLHDAETLELTARLWDSAAFASLVCAANADSVAALTPKGDVVIWDLARGGEVRVLPELGRRPTGLAWVAADASFVVAVKDALLVVDPVSGSVKKRIERASSAGDLAGLSPDGRWLAQVGWLETPGKRSDAGSDSGDALPSDLPPEPAPSESRSNGIGLTPAQTGRPHLLLSSLEGAKTRDLGVVAAYGDARFSADGRRVALTTERGIEVFDVASGSVVRRITTPPREPAPFDRQVEPFGALSPDGGQVVARSQKWATFEVWDIADGRAGKPFLASGSAGGITLARDGRSSVTAEGQWHALPGGAKLGTLAGPIGRRCVGPGSRWVAGPDEHGIAVLARNGRSVTLSRLPQGLAWRMFARAADGTFDAADEVLTGTPMRFRGRIVMASSLGELRKRGLVADFVAGLEKAP